MSKKEPVLVKLGQPFGMVVIEDGKVRMQGPMGYRVCRLDQPHEIGICITEIMTNNKLGQPAYRAVNNTIAASGEENK